MTDPTAAPDDPHRGQAVLSAGAALSEAAGAMIMLHGRGAGAADIVGLEPVIDQADLAYFAPEAAERSWWPRPFTAPAAANEPYVASALAAVSRLIAYVEERGIPPERVALLGFSQGACLALEYAARNPRRYGAVLALSGGLIGATVVADSYAGSLAGTPVFVGCSDMDPFIPLARVQQSVAVMAHLDADVTERIYPGSAHTIVADEIAHVKRILARMVG
jgi:predicted esterase